MGEGRTKAQALLLAALLLMMMSSSAIASPYNTRCIPRRLLMASGSSYPGQRGPCNDDPIYRPTPSGSNDDGHKQSSGYRVPQGPPPPTGGHKRAAAAPPENNN